VFTELSAGDSSLGRIPQNHFFFVSVLAHPHDPRRWKVRHIGDWELNDVPPPRNGIV
jgi:hypothetical protein